jgi:tetratricopeptide (TPR) repeat protein
VVLPQRPAVTPKATLPAADLGDVRHLWQSLNNCGPASVVMALSSFGITADQEAARLALRGPDWRRGMSPVGVDPWVRELYGLRAVWRNNGTNDLIKALISNGFAPLVTQWMEDPSVSRIAHWRSVVGYDDRAGVFYSNDPMRGRYVPLAYDWFDRVWQPFSYRYLVMYRPEDEALLRAIVGDQWSDRLMRDAYYDRAKAEAARRPDAASLLAYGEAAYQDGHFDEAVAAFQQGLALGSAEGVFTLRGSYPQALRALGREAEALAVQQRLSATAPVSTVAAPPPDGLALAIAAQRMLAEPQHLSR